MLRAVALCLALGSLAAAPFQCASKIDPNKKTEEDPSEGLYRLSEKFKAEGNQAAREETLRFLIARYPSSRFAEAAKLELEESAKH